MNCIGTYDGTIFYNPANKFCIISVKTADQSVPAEARSNRRYKDHLIRFTAVGYEIPRTDMGKIFVLSVTDHEEYILSRIMEIIAAEPEFDHIVSSHPCNTLVFPGLELRLKERTVHRNGELVSMTHREFATLVYLANHPSWVFSAGQIYEEVWGEDGENCGTAVASVIGQIRRKLTPDMPKAGYIRTVLGSGYKFEVPQGMAE